MHIGCGVGYYTAIMAELAGKKGRVVGIEFDKRLAKRAAGNLASYKQAVVVAGDGSGYDAGEADAMFVNAGVTHFPELWLDNLARGGRLLVPHMTNAWAGGNLLLIKRVRSELRAKFVAPIMIYRCHGSFDD